jgi:putative cardiolipin synthase
MKLAAVFVGLGWLAAGLGCSSSPAREDAPVASPTTVVEAFDALARAGGPSEVIPLMVNEPSWSWRWAALERAKTSIDVTYFILADDVIGTAFLGKLIEKANEGVRVRLLIDTRGVGVMAPAFVLSARLSDVAEKAPVDVRFTGPAVPRFVQALSHLDITPLLSSNHDKMIIIDGEEVTLGGRNIGRDYFAGHADVSFAFTDVDLAVRGVETVAGLQAAFDFEWQNASPMALSATPPSPYAANTFEVSKVAMQQWLRAPPFDEATAAAHRDKGSDAHKATASAMVEQALAQQSTPVISTERARLDELADELAGYPTLRGVPAPEAPWFDVEARVLDSFTRTAATNDTANDEIIALVRAVQRKVVLLNPYIVLTERGFGILKETCDRGIDITMFTNSPASSDSSTTQAFFLRMWPEIMAACPTARLYVLNVWRPLHGKVAVLDDEVTLLGSYNLDYLSAYINGEIGLAIKSRAFADHMTKTIEGRIAKGPPEVLEYRIERDAQGRPVRFERGLLAGRVKVAFGPDDHCPQTTLARLRTIQKALDWTGPFWAVTPLMREVVDDDDGGAAPTQIGGGGQKEP